MNEEGELLDVLFSDPLIPSNMNSSAFSVSRSKLYAIGMDEMWEEEIRVFDGNEWRTLSSDHK